MSEGPQPDLEEKGPVQRAPLDEGTLAEIEALCGDPGDEDFFSIYEGFTYWCEGVLMVPVGTVGLLGNILAIYVLSSKEFRRFPFHHLLVGLSVFDLVFIVCSVPVHIIPVLQTPLLEQLSNTWLFSVLYKFLLYPFSTVAYCGGVYMTTAITLERFVAVRYPLRYRNQVMSSNPLIRALKFICPAVAAALIFNIPKFLEVNVREINGTLHYQPSKLRMDPTFVYWYTHSLIIHPFLTTTLIPILSLCVMNAFIYRGVVKNRRRRPGTVSSLQPQHGEVNLQAVIVIICLVFVVTHIPRLILAITAFNKASNISRCLDYGRLYIPTLYLACLESLSNLLILINASANFIIYCCSSTHFKVFLYRRFTYKVTHRPIIVKSSDNVNCCNDNITSVCNNRHMIHLNHDPNHLQIMGPPNSVHIHGTEANHQEGLNVTALKNREENDNEDNNGIIHEQTNSTYIMSVNARSEEIQIVGDGNVEL